MEDTRTLAAALRPMLGDRRLYLDTHARDVASSFASRSTIWLLSLYAGVMLVFFSISTNQEYYTFPAYLPLLMLTAGVLASFELRAERMTKSAEGLMAG